MTSYREAIQPHVARARREGRTITHVVWRKGHADVTLSAAAARPDAQLL